MSRLASISSDPVIREFAHGAAQNAIQPVADFLAPVVEVAQAIGRYKKYTEKHRFSIPETRRAIGGRANELRFTAEDVTYNCEPHALDYPIDRIEQNEAEALENMLQEGAQAVAEVAALAHEKRVIDAALTAAGTGTAKTWDDSADPVADLDESILTVLKAARYGSLMRVGVLFGATAFRIFKNAANVRDRFTLGGSGASTRAVPTLDNVGPLFIGEPEVRASYMVYDSAPAGVADNIRFLLDNTVLVFARHPQPTRRDPSFMKTFRLRGQWLVPGTYARDDGRVEVAKYDWSEDVRVTNSAAIARLNISGPSE